MKTRLTLALMAFALAACAGGAERRGPGPAIEDFIVVNELEAQPFIRTTPNWRHEKLDETYVLLNLRDEHVLVKFFVRCFELRDFYPEADLRRDHNRLYAGQDTIRGCRIESMYPLDAGQAQELREIAGDAAD